MIIKRLSFHASERMYEEFKQRVNPAQVVKSAQACDYNGYKVSYPKAQGLNEETYLVLPEHGVWTVKDGELTTFIGRTRMTPNSRAAMAYNTFSKKKVL